LVNIQPKQKENERNKIAMVLKIEAMAMGIVSIVEHSK
jgi:hypothetical protein